MSFYDWYDSDEFKEKVLKVKSNSSSKYQDCEHKLIHLDTKKSCEPSGYNIKYTRIDNFYCEKCGETVTKNKTDYCREEPEWY